MSNCGRFNMILPAKLPIMLVVRDEWLEQERAVARGLRAARLSRVNELLSNARKPAPEPESNGGEPDAAGATRQQILEDLEQGKIGATEAAKLLRLQGHTNQTNAS